ncbi:MAG: hemolysin family protein [Planctomycetota bacterium]
MFPEGWIWTALKLATVPLFLAANAFFVAAEFALVSVRRTRIEALVRQGNSAAKSVKAAVADLDRYIAATQLGITLASIALGWLGKPAMEAILAPVFERLPWRVTEAVSLGIASVFAYLFITFLHVVLGELAPKTVALQRAEKTSLWVAAPLLIFERIFRPFIWSMNATGNWVVRRFGMTTAAAHVSVHSVEELMMLVDQSHAAGVIHGPHRELIGRIFTFDKKRVKDVMIPREKIIAIELKTPHMDILKRVGSDAFTRVPIYEDDFDNCVGILHTKDLFRMIVDRKMFHLFDLLRSAHVIPPDEPIGQVLRQFQKSRNHIALVKEGEKIVGLVTLEDIMEEVFGEIQDEHDVSPS